MLEEQSEPVWESDARKLRARNEEQPISQLPYELLLQIFTNGVLPPHASRYPALLKKHCSTKRYLAQVCHRWRNVALESPDVWCNAVDLASGSYWIGEVLRRSRGRPINVFIPSGTKEEHIALVLYTHRIRGLYANIQDPRLARKVLDLLQGLKELEELDLVTCKLPRSCLRGRDDGWRDPTPPNDFPWGLRRLYLNGPSIQLPSRQMVTLTCLYVTHPWGSKTPFQWLTAIRKFPQLQELSLISCIQADGIVDPSSENEPIPVLSPPLLIPLPHLRELELRGDHSACGAVFRGLKIPSSCVFRLGTQDAAAGPTLNAVVDFLRSDKSCPSPHRSGLTRSLYLKICFSQVYLQVFEEEVVKLSIHLKYIEWHLRQAHASLSIVAELLLAAHARFCGTGGGFGTLMVSLPGQPSRKNCPNAWLVALQHPLSEMKEVQNLWLQGTITAWEFLKYLEGRGAIPPAATCGVSDPTLFPNLRQITLANVDAEETEGIFVPSHLNSLMLRHPKLKVVHLYKCKHLQSLVELKVLYPEIIMG